MQLIRQAIAELREVLFHLRQLLAPLFRVDLEQMSHRLRRHINAIGVDARFARLRHKADRRVVRVGHPLAPTEHPRQDA